MPETTTRVISSLGGISIEAVITKTEEGQISDQATLAAADAGTLTTRTNDTDGTITLSAGHSISNGDIIDIYWTDGNGDMQVAYGATVGTVGTDDTVPFTGASGTALPVVDTSVTVDEEVEINADFDGDDAVKVMLHSTRKWHYRFQDSGDADLSVGKRNADEPFMYFKDITPSNPLTGNPVDAVLVSNGDSDNSATVKLGVQQDTVS